HVAEIFDGPRPQQRIPRLDTGGGPVGHAHQEIVGQFLRRMIVAVSRPYGETQVVAYDRTYPPSFPGSYQKALSRAVGLLFLGHPEEMALVVRAEISTGFHPQQSVIKPIPNIADKASQHERTGLIGHLPHPFCGAHIHHFRQTGSRHCKAGREHLREDDNIGGAANAPDFFLERGQVRPNILPVKIRLYDCDVQIRHNSGANKGNAGKSTRFVKSCPLLPTFRPSWQNKTGAAAGSVVVHKRPIREYRQPCASVSFPQPYPFRTYLTRHGKIRAESTCRGWGWVQKMIRGVAPGTSRAFSGRRIRCCHSGRHPSDIPTTLFVWLC